MDSDLFNNIPDDAPVDAEVIREVKTGLSQLGKDIILNKKAEATVLQESMADGGPGSVNEAIINLMHSCNVGIRFLAQKTGIKRKRLLMMIEGHIEMPPEVLGKITDVFRTRQPSLFSFEKPSKG